MIHMGVIQINDRQKMAMKGVRRETTVRSFRYLPNLPSRCIQVLALIECICDFATIYATAARRLFGAKSVYWIYFCCTACGQKAGCQRRHSKQQRDAN